MKEKVISCLIIKVTIDTLVDNPRWVYMLVLMLINYIYKNQEVNAGFAR